MSCSTFIEICKRVGLLYANLMSLLIWVGQNTHIGSEKGFEPTTHSIICLYQNHFCFWHSAIAWVSHRVTLHWRKVIWLSGRERTYAARKQTRSMPWGKKADGLYGREPTNTMQKQSRSMLWGKKADGLYRREPTYTMQKQSRSILWGKKADGLYRRKLINIVRKRSDSIL